MMYTNFQKVNGLKSVEVARMQVTEWRVNPAYKLQVAFSCFMWCFFIFSSGFLFFEPLALSGIGRDSHETRAM